MNIAIIDAEIIGKKKHRFPNLACMKLSSYYKPNNVVSLKTNYDKLDCYDKVFISKVFTDTFIPNDILNLPNVEYGGTGFYYDKAPSLPFKIEHIKPDYNLYNEWVANCISEGANKKEFTYYENYSIGFLTRGCFRQCEFCVNKNYKSCNVHSPLDEFIDESRPKLCFLDDNFFACKDWKQIIDTVKTSNKKFQFKQGLDERLLDGKKIKELIMWKYDGDYIFAFDNIEDKQLIESKLKMLRTFYKNKGQNIKFYIFCGYDRNSIYDNEFWGNDIKSIFERILTLSKYNCKSYLMRYNKYKDSPIYGTYVNLSAWINQPSLFFNHSYKEFCEKDNKRKGGHSATIRYYNEFVSKYPKIAQKYFDIVPKDILQKVNNNEM